MYIYAKRSIPQNYVEGYPLWLAHIQPIGGKIRWPRKVNELTKLLIEKREGWMRIRGSTQDETAIVDFKPKPQSEDERGDLKELLIKIGCAQGIQMTVAIPGILPREEQFRQLS